MEKRRAVRVAENERSGRRVNASIDEERTQKGQPSPRWLMCECLQADCAELIDVGAAKYREVRDHPHRFIVARGHDMPEFEAVVEATPQYLVVEKTADAPVLGSGTARGVVSAPRGS